MKSHKTIKRSFLAAAVAVFGVCGASADFGGTTTWQGGDGEWSDAANWDYGVPLGGTNFNINAAGTITFSSAAEVTMPGEYVNNGMSPVVFSSEGEGAFGLTWNTAQWQEFCVGRTGHGYVRFDSGTYDLGGWDRTMLCVGWWWYNSVVDGEFSKGRIDVIDANVTNVRGINLGYDCGDGLLVVNGSGSISVSDWVGVAIGQRALGEIVVTNGTLSVANQLYVGGFNSDVDLNGAAGTVSIEGGTINAGYVAMAVQTGATGTINLNGGTFATKRIWTLPNRGSGTIIIDGGTLRKSQAEEGAFIDDGIDVRVGAGGAIFDTNGFDATVNAEISGADGDGGLVKKGAGTLKLMKGKTWNGPTRILEGTLDLNGMTLDGDVYVAPGARIITTIPADSTGDFTSDISLVRKGGSYAKYSVDALSVSGTKTILNSVSGLIGAAAVRYDPSDEDSMTVDEFGNVTAIANKGYLGAAMDASAVGGERGAPFVSEAFKENGRKCIAFTNSNGFVANNKLLFPENQPRSAFTCSARYWPSSDPAPDSLEKRMCPLYLDVNNGGWWFGTLQGANNDTDALSFLTVSKEGSSSLVNVYDPIAANAEGTFALRYINANGERLNAGVEYMSQGSLVAGVVPNEKQYDLLSASESPLALYYGNNNALGGMCGLLGEALLYTINLSDADAEVVRKHLANKWLGANEAIATNATTIAALALEDKAEVDFDGADVSLCDVTGSGTLKNGNFTINGTITISVDDNGEIEPIVVNGNVTFGANAAVHVVGASKLLRVDVPFLRVEGEGNSISGRIWSVTTDNEKPAYVTKAGTVYKICKGSRGLMVIIR